MNKLYLYTVSEEYMKYLSSKDEHIMFSYNQKKTRPFLCFTIKVKSQLYCVPLTSPKKKHKTMKNGLYLIKIDGGNLGALNLNNMFPVDEKNISFTNKY